MYRLIAINKMRVTVEIVWTLGGRRKHSEVYCADTEKELESIRQYFIDEKEKLTGIPTAAQTAWFEAYDGSHPYGWNDAKNCVNNKQFNNY